MLAAIVTRPKPTLLITRPKVQAQGFAAALERAEPGRWQVVIAPLLEIVPGEVPGDLSGISALIFTSRSGVEVFAAQNPDRDLPSYCVGARTAARARDLGFTAHSANGDVAALQALIAADLRGRPGQALHLRGTHSAGALAAALRETGIETAEVIIYDQRPLPVPAAVARSLKQGKVDAVVLFSPRSAAHFVAELARVKAPPPPIVACISAATAAKMPGVACLVADQPTEAAILHLLVAPGDLPY